MIYFTVKKTPSYVTTIPMLGLLVTAYGVGWMIQPVDDGYHIVRLSGPVIILFSNSNSFYMDMLCVF